VDTLCSKFVHMCFSIVIPFDQVGYKDTFLQDACAAVIPPQCGCMATKSRGQELRGTFDAILQLEIKSVDNVNV
jgi:hypothetical protein